MDKMGVADKRMTYPLLFGLPAVLLLRGVSESGTTSSAFVSTSEVA